MYIGVLVDQQGAKDNDENYDDDHGMEEDGIEDPLCMDLHPLCLKWADSGECEANPNYMVGSAVTKGHCKKSCGVCTPRKWGAALGVDPVVDTSGEKYGIFGASRLHLSLFGFHGACLTHCC